MKTMDPHEEGRYHARNYRKLVQYGARPQGKSVRPVPRGHSILDAGPGRLDPIYPEPYLDEQGEMVEPEDPRPMPHWHRAFLDGMRVTSNIRKSAQSAGVSYRVACQALKLYPRLMEETLIARAESIEILRMTAWDRAVAGRSDKVLMFLLKALDPETFGNKTRTEITGKDGGPIAHAINYADARARLYRRLLPEAAQETEGEFTEIPE